MAGVPSTEWRCGDQTLRLDDRPYVMGIVNATPDSFSDGGQFLQADAAIAHGMDLCEAGADILDVGGESTRPGATAVATAEELRRVIPVIRKLRDRTDAVISVDTTKAAVAAQALEAGACIVNDVSACTGDPQMPRVVSDAGCGVVLMHMQGRPRTMQEAPRYEHVVREVRDYLAERAKDMEEAGTASACIALDPGIGFGKTLEHNLDLLAGLHELLEIGYPVLLGVSRKRFLGALTGREVGERLAGSLAAATYGVVQGAAILRVHDVAETVDMVKVIRALQARKAT